MTLDLDFELSPYTGWTRSHWQALGERMLAALDRYWSPAGARIDLPGPASRNGVIADGIEGFCRTFLVAAALVAGRDGADPADLLGRYGRGLAAAMDPDSRERWPRPSELLEVKVEAALLVVGLQLTKPWLWDQLDQRDRDNTIAWLSDVIGTWYPPSNWMWFRLMVESFLRQEGGPWRPEDIRNDLSVHAWMRKPGGWLTDGGSRAYDHYVGWILHAFPLLWTQLFDVVGTLCPPEVRDRWVTDLEQYTGDVLHLVGADGSPLFQGRSLTYRFATAAPLWTAAMFPSGAHHPGSLRRAASGMVKHFEDRGAFGEGGLLSLGWHGAWTPMRQTYSGPGSPYFASLGMLGLALPETHPVWTERERPLPIEEADFSRVIHAPGWLASGRRDNGFVTIINHGTDHQNSGSDAADAPVYGRLGYSTVTAPLLAGRGVTDPLDNSVVLIDREGRASHRTGFRTLFVEELNDGVQVAASQGPVRWLRPDGDPAANFGTYPAGEMTPGPSVTVASVLRDGVELRFARVEGPTDAVALRVGGWPVAAQECDESRAGAEGDRPVAFVETESLFSSVIGVSGFTESGVSREDGANPLGSAVAVPWVSTNSVRPGQVYVGMVSLQRARTTDSTPEIGVTHLADGADVITIEWPAGAPATTFCLA